MPSPLVVAFSDFAFGESGLLLPFFVPVVLYCFYQVLLSTIRVISTWQYRPIEPRTDGGACYTYSDVTIISVISDPAMLKGLQEAMASWAKCQPSEVILCTTKELEKPVQKISDLMVDLKVRVITDEMDSHHQFMAAANAVITPVIAVAEPDALWKPSFLEYMVAPFEQTNVKAVCSSVEIALDRRLSSILADMATSLRSAELCAYSVFDGSTVALPGQTTLIRREVVQDTKFQQELLGPKNRTQNLDEFIWAWLMSNKLDIAFQLHKGTSLVKKFDNMREAMSHISGASRQAWRNDIRALFVQGFVWSRYPFLAARMMMRVLQPLFAVYFLATFITLVVTTPAWRWDVALICWAIWTGTCSLFTMVTSWSAYPRDLLYLPLFASMYVMSSLADVWNFTATLISFGHDPARPRKARRADSKENDCATAELLDSVSLSMPHNETASVDSNSELLTAPDVPFVVEDSTTMDSVPDNNGIKLDRNKSGVFPKLVAMHSHVDAIAPADTASAA